MDKFQSKIGENPIVVLLWKNFLLKRNSPWVTVFELATPLVLFVLLLGLRQREPVAKYGGTYFHPQPLPSAGMLAVLQEFCPSNDGRDVYGFPMHNKSMIGPFLDHLHHVWDNHSVLTRNISSSYSNFKSFKDAKHNSSHSPLYHHHRKNMQLKFLVKNPSSFNKFLIHNLSLSDEEASDLMNSSVNLKKFAGASPNRKHNRLKRNLEAPFFHSVLENLQVLSSYQPTGTHSDLSSVFSPIIKDQIRSIIATDPSKYSDPFVEQKMTALEAVLITPDNLHELVCSDHDVLNPSRNQTKAAVSQLCNGDNSTSVFEQLASELRRQVNSTALLQDMAAPDQTPQRILSQRFGQHLELVLSDIEDLQQISAYLSSLSSIVQILPLIPCEEDIAPKAKVNETAPVIAPAASSSWNETTSAPYVIANVTEATTSRPETTLPHKTEAPPKVAKKSQQEMKKESYIELWAAMQPVLCGPEKDSKTPRNLTNFKLTSSQKFHLGVLIHVLTSNPKILYAPNTTQINDVIRKANTSFAIIGNITNAANQWRNISRKIRRVLTDPSVDDTLLWLNQTKESYRKHPELVMNLTNGFPLLQSYMSNNQTLPNKTALITKLDTVDRAACSWKKFVSGISIDWFKGFTTEDDAVEYATSHAYHDNASVFATLVFDVNASGHLKQHVIYKIRQNASFTQDTTQIRLSYWRPDPFNWDLRYYDFGFVWLQDVIERSIIWEMVGHDVVSPGAYMHEMPYPCYRFDVFSMDLEHIMPLAMILSWVYTVAMLVQHIVYEKERRLKEVMKIMGLSNGVHWLAWFISTFLQLQISVTTIALILKFGNVLGTSNLFITWLFFSVYAAATIMFCFLLSVIFSKAKVASACSGIIYFMTYLPFAYITIQEFVLHNTVPVYAKIFSSLLSTTAFGLGAKYFAMYELSGYGIQWDNIALTPVEGDTFSLIQAIYMMIGDIFLYAVLTWYIEAVFPGQFGLPRPWYFPFTESYWLGHGGTESHCFGCCGNREDDVTGTGMDFDDDALIEPEPLGLSLGVKIQKLTKKYKRGKKKALNKLSLNLYEDQITSFLGHNGAGKTTTMSILTGLIPPTSGTAFIYGCDIRSSMLEIRRSLGMCPQHNVLFDVLTVQEHLWFYARLKGVRAKLISSEMDQFLKDIGLESKRNAKVETLSGGMKRKLSVAIAFVGGSRTVILDEPTAGVDPYARRAIWDLIIKYKEGRTILLSTHHMDEADLLGDRIAILSSGRLRCVGSSTFLKSNYGDGYMLTLIKKERQLAAEANAVSNQVTSSEEKVSKFVKEQVPSALLSTSSSAQISFQLPLESVRKGCFQRLFDRLPDRMEELEVQGYGLNDTTLESVFLKVDDKSKWESEDSYSERERLKHAKMQSSSSFLGSSNFEPDTSCPSTSSNSSPAMTSTRHDVTPHKLFGSGDDVDDVPLIDLAPTSSHDQAAAWDSNPGPLEPVATDTALEWLNSAPCVDTAEETVAASGQAQPAEYESRLLEMVFGQSSFSEATVTGATDTATMPEATVPRDPVPDDNADDNVDADDDVPLLDLGGNSEGKGSYELTPLVRNLRIIQGLLVKRFHYARRNRKAVFYQIMLPALFVIIAMTVALSLPTARDPPPLVLSPSQYRNVTQPKGNFIPITDQSVLFPVSGAGRTDAGPSDIMDTFWLPSGVGATCVLRHQADSTFTLAVRNQTAYSAQVGDLKMISKYFDPMCQSSFTRGIPMSQFLPPDPSLYVNSLNKTVALNLALKTDVPCSCTKDGNAYVCWRSIGLPPTRNKAVTGDWLLDVTGKYPILQYLMYTTTDFRLHRYGALSFGEVRSHINQSFPGWPSPLRKLAVRDAAQVFYNHKGYHSMPIYLNVLNNAVLRANLPKSKNAAAYGITVINHPMNKTAGALSLDFLFSGTDMIIAIFIIVAMSFIPASFLLFLVAEKSSRAKHLQFISGTGPVTYWISNYVWDMLNYLFPAAVCIVILQIFDLPAYTRGENASAVVALFLLYGWSMTPMMYPASFYFDVPSTAYVCMIVLNLFVGITTVVSTFMISLFRNDPRMVALEAKLESAFLIFPNYNLGRGLMMLTYNEFMNEYYNKIGETDKVRSPFEWDLVTRQLVAMAIEGVAGIVITMLFQVNFFWKRNSLRDVTPGPRAPPRGGMTSLEDVDVANERHRVTESGRDDLIVVDGVSKVYNKKHGRVLAVNKLSFGVARGECFGLLGVNGAGKTTTFSMMTGDTGVTSGEIVIDGHRVASGNAQERLLAQQTTGYCPQFDALFNELTPMEHLLLYARLRGIPSVDEQRVARWAIEKLDLTRHQDKPAGDLSGGNRRKLSVAIALIGDPALVLLDEPTTGMDPAARRFLWDLILDVTKSGRAVVLTSHSMEECEILCSKLAIMVNGRLECFGPAQHLKNKFGDGYMITVRTTKPEQTIERFVGAFPNSIVKEHHYHKVAFQLCSSPGGVGETQEEKEEALSLSAVFRFLEENRSSMGIEDYSVSQTTLDDVFVNFARRQKSPEGTSPFSLRAKMAEMVSRLFSVCCRSTSDQQPQHQPGQSSTTRSNLHLRGSPEGARLLEDNEGEDIEEDDQPLYTFDQSMSLSFIDSTC